MSKGLKIGIGLGVIVLVAIVLYFLLRKSSGTWKAVKGGDIAGAQYDMESYHNSEYTSLETAKAHANEIGAKSFLINGTTTYFKNANGPVTTDPNGTYTLYIKQ